MNKKSAKKINCCHYQKQEKRKDGKKNNSSQVTNFSRSEKYIVFSFYGISKQKHEYHSQRILLLHQSTVFP